MKIIVICFFSVFFLVSLIGIIFRLKVILRKNDEVKIELYNNSKLATNLSNVYVGRLSDSTVRSSVRYHKSLYKNNSDYEEYREGIRKLELP